MARPIRMHAQGVQLMHMIGRSNVMCREGRLRCEDHRRERSPELGSDLVAALASLHMDDFTARRGGGMVKLESMER